LDVFTSDLPITRVANAILRSFINHRSNRLFVVFSVQMAFETATSDVNERKKLILLHGFDGTGMLFAPFLRELPPEIVLVDISYPSDRICSVNELLSTMLSHLPKSEPYVLLAESWLLPKMIAPPEVEKSPISPLATASASRPIDVRRQHDDRDGRICRRRQVMSAIFQDDIQTVMHSY
jgi:hypothetical protein